MMTPVFSLNSEQTMAPRQSSAKKASSPDYLQAFDAGT
jgi:hypothetical protein